jgi:hypothetical protein
MKARVATTDAREKKALALLGVLPLSVLLLFHLWQEWSVFGGRAAFVVRHGATSTGMATLLEGLLFVVPMLAWVVLLGRAVVRGAALPGQAREGDPPLARLLGGVVRFVSPLAALYFVVHAGTYFGGRVAHGESPLWAYDLLRTTMGQPLWLVLNGVGVTASCWHLAATLPDGLEAAGIVGPEGRRSAYWVTAVLGACLFVLYAQLAGWLATGVGTFWPIELVSPDAT